ncbi:MAG: hypothetical protein ACKOC4_06375 [Planctomycetia bacterium]
MARFDRLFGVFTSRSRRQPLRKPSLDGGEQLERRSMLAADVVGGILTITGSEAADQISISAVKQSNVFVPGSVRVRGVPGVTNNTVFTGVNSIVVSTFGGNDRVTVGSGLTRAAGGLMGVTVDAGQGTDVVVGGDGDDTIFGNDGRDTLRGGRGNDSIDGGTGDDRVDGDDGADALLGGIGRDDVRGGRGNDTLYGGRDNDRLFGDDGDDDLDGEEGDDRLTGGRGNDDDVDDDDSLSDLRRGSTEDSGDNGNDDLDENEDADDDDGDLEDDDEDGGEDDGGDDTPVGTVLAFTSGSETLTGTSASKRDKVFYSLTVPQGSSWTLTVTLNPVNNRYPDLEIERTSAGPEFERELEPTENPSQTSGEFLLPAGTYSLRLRSPDLQPVNYNVSLTRTVNPVT